MYSVLYYYRLYSIYVGVLFMNSLFKNYILVIDSCNVHFYLRKHVILITGTKKNVLWPFVIDNLLLNMNSSYIR